MPACGDCGKGFGSGGCSGIHTDRWNGSCAQKFTKNCPDCMDVFNSSNRRRTHMNNQHTSCSCSECGKKFYEKARQDQHQKDKQHDKNQAAAAAAKEFPCGGCPKKFSALAIRDQHQKDTRHQTPSVSVGNEMTRQLATGNSQQTSFPCGGCSKKFSALARRDQHQNDTRHQTPFGNEMVHQPASGNDQHTSFPCGGCSKTFREQSQRDQHVGDTSHSPPTPGNATNMGARPKESNYDINKAARKYHDTHARPPKTPQKDPNFSTFHKVTGKLYDEMKEQKLVTKRVGVGSVYERTNIQKTSDFDVLYVNRNPAVKASRPDNLRPGFVILEKDGKQISPVDHIDKTKGAINKILNKTDFEEITVKMHDHGPAITLNVHDKKTGQFMISIDAVPSIELRDGSSYVAKFPKPGREWGKETNAWRMSHSYEAREKMLTLDLGSKCHREVYRTLKVMRTEEPNLHHMTSYQLKSALFHVSDLSSGDWGREKIGERCGEVLQYVKSAYETGHLPDYFEPKINLLDGSDPRNNAGTSNRLGVLLKHPHKMFPINEE